MWNIEKLSNLSGIEVFQLLKARIDTFVVEQTRIYYEADAIDLEAYHVFHKNESGEVDAYARIFEKDDHVVFGRVLTSKGVRGTGIGGRLVEKIMEFCNEKFPDRDIVIEAQVPVAGLYKKFGFHIEGEEFLHEGTPYITMRYSR